MAKKRGTSLMDVPYVNWSNFVHLSINTQATKNHREARPLRFEVFYTPAKNLFTYHLTIEWNHFAPMFSRDFLKHSKLVVTELSVFKSIRYFVLSSPVHLVQN